MLNKATKYLVVIVSICFFGANIFLAYYGIYSILFTATVYLLLGLFLWYLLGLGITNPVYLANIRLLLVSVTLCFFMAEVTLKYITQTNISYSEANGDFFYSSVYRRAKVREFIAIVFPKKLKEMTVMNKPNSTKVHNTVEFNYEHHYNSLGLRGNEPIADTNKVTIVALGDSFTEGKGAPQDSSWVHLLQDKLNARNVLSAEVQCINGGLSGSDVIFEFQVLKKYLLDFNPQYVVLAINSSDINDIIVRGGNERFGPNGQLMYREGLWWEWIYQVSHIARSVVHTFGDYDWLLLTPEQRKSETDIALKIIKQSILDDFVPLSKAKNFKLIVVLNPRLHELENNYFSLAVLCDDSEMKETVTLINLHPKFSEWKRKEGRAFHSIFWPIDLHHTPEGYDILSEMMVDSTYY